MDNRLY